MKPLQAVILTGARDVHNPLLAGTGLQSKVLLPVGGKPMVLSVLENITASKYRPSVYISTGDPQIKKLPTPIPYKVLPSEDRAVASLLKSLERVPGDGWVLVVSGDHPLLTTKMIDYFVDEAMRRDLALSAAVVDRRLVQVEYPESRRTWFEAKGGAYSGGNMYLIDKSRFMSNPAILETIDNNRKAPWKSIKLLDLWSIILILLHRLDIHAITERASRIFRCKTGVVVMPFAECCMDVDKPSDKDIAEQILARRQEQQQAKMPAELPLAAS